MKGHLRERPSRRKKGRRKTGESTFELIVAGKSTDSGKRKALTRTFHGTRGDANAALRDYIRELEQGGFAVGQSEIRVGPYLERWLAYVADRVSERTLDSYRDTVQFHLTPYIGNMKLTELAPLHIDELQKRLSTSGRRTKRGGALSATSVNYACGRLSAALDHAVKRRIIDRNVCRATEPLRSTRTEMRTLDAAELHRLFEAAEGTRLYEPIVLGGMTGMRRGEILGLRWCDIDFEAQTISIERALLPNGTLARPKTERSRRRIAMPTTVAGALHRHKAAQNVVRLGVGASYNRDGLVFVDAFGARWKPDSIGCLFASIVKRAELGKLRFHDLRHTAASLMIAAGVPITVVAATLGHAKTSMTLSVYAHALKGAETTAALAMEGTLKGAAAAR